MSDDVGDVALGSRNVPDAEFDHDMEHLERLSPYVHLPLPHDGNFIRLLHLKPASDARAPIRATLTIDRLRPEIFYEALSYCWGDLSVSESINVDGKILAVTTNLAAALRSLRRSVERRVIWIDAICINQSNIEEKNRQVSLMREIYAHSCITIVWQGPSDEWSRSFLLPRTRRARLFDTYHLVQDWLRASSPRLATVDRPWISRIWVAQEFAYSKNIVVHFGHDKCTWQMFRRIMISPHYRDDNVLFLCDAMDLMRTKIAKGTRFEILDAQRMFRASESTRAVDKVFAIVGLLQRPTDVAIDYSIDHRTLFRDIALDIMSRTQSLDALGDALQKKEVFKLDGMMHWIPDWSDNDSAFRTRLLPKAGVGNSDERPSAGVAMCRASRDSFEMPILQPDGTLAVYAHFIAQVEEVGELFMDLFNPWGQTPIWPQDSRTPHISGFFQFILSVHSSCQDWIHLACRINGPNGTLHDRYSTGQTIREALYFTCSRLDVPNTYKSSLEMDELWNLMEWAVQIVIWAVRTVNWALRRVFWWPLALVLMLCGGPILAVTSLIIICGKSRLEKAEIIKDILDDTFDKEYIKILGRTDNGLLGMFPGPSATVSNRLAAIPGDSVVLLKGASMPFVVRKSGEHWKLVGEAYIHGIMYGAAFKTSQCEIITLC